MPRPLLAWALFAALLVCLGQEAAAFQPQPLVTRVSSSRAPPPQGWAGSSVQLPAMKPGTGGKKDAETTDRTDPDQSALGMVLLYLTPWRNPNSIFVYMFLVLYGLGKYSEAHM